MNDPMPTTKLEWALWHARRGFFVFPLRANSKKPAVTRWQEWATREEAKIREWWERHPDNNIGIFTEKYGDNGEALFVVDVDIKRSAANG